MEKLRFLYRQSFASIAAINAICRPFVLDGRAASDTILTSRYFVKLWIFLYKLSVFLNNAFLFQFYTVSINVCVFFSFAFSLSRLPRLVIGTNFWKLLFLDLLRTLTFIIFLFVTDFPEWINTLYTASIDGININDLLFRIVSILWHSIGPLSYLKPIIPRSYYCYFPVMNRMDLIHKYFCIFYSAKVIK